MSGLTASNMAPPKPILKAWTLLFKTAYNHGLLSPVACDLLQLPHSVSSPYSKNSHYQVADITMKKLRELDYNRFPNLNGEMILTAIGMIGPSNYEPDDKSRKRWSNDLIYFLQPLVVRLPSKHVPMGGTLNDLLVLYFEKLTRKFTSKKALSGPEGQARFHKIRVECGIIYEVVPEVVPEVTPEIAPQAAEEPEPVLIIDRGEIPDSWEDE
jgi:hypothetical protein